jgi:hypothetical protein
MSPMPTNQRMQATRGARCFLPRRLPERPRADSRVCADRALSYPLVAGLPVCAPSQDGERVKRKCGAQLATTRPWRSSYCFIPTKRMSLVCTSRRLQCVRGARAARAGCAESREDSSQSYAYRSPSGRSLANSPPATSVGSLSKVCELRSELASSSTRPLLQPSSPQACAW